MEGAKQRGIGQGPVGTGMLWERPRGALPQSECGSRWVHGRAIHEPGEFGERGIDGL